MPTKGQFSRERNVKNLSGRDGQKKGNSQHDQIAHMPKDRVTAVNGNVDGKFEDRIRVAKNERFQRERESWSGERVASMKGSKPWPGRKATTADELVKHMSNVPSYLQRKETADHLQDKALNVGVLEWGLLANWSQQQKHELARSHGASPSNTSRSVLFSSPSHSSASPSSRSLESNQSTPMTDHHHASIRAQQSRLVDKHHGKRYSPSTNSAVLSLLPGHGKHPCPDKSYNYLSSGLSNASLPSVSLGSSSRSCRRHEMVEDEETRKKIQDVVHHCSRRLFTDSDNIGKNFFTSNNNDSTCNDPDKGSDLNGEFFESLISDAVMEMDTVRNCSKSSDGFLDCIEPCHEYPQIPYSCPLPIIDSAAKEIGTTSTKAGDNLVCRPAKISKNHNRNPSAMSVTGNPPQCSAKFSDRMPDRHVGSGMNRVSRSSSLKDAPYGQQPDIVPSVDKIGDRSSSNSKGRRSPLRRMLDPILKPRHSSPVRPSFVPKCHLPVNTPKQSLDLGAPVPQNAQRKSIDMIVNSNNPTEADINQPPRVLLNSTRYLQKGKDSATTRQALLQLAWKNGLPLFMLSYGDSDILAATVRRKGISEKDDLESTYAVFTVEEPKKKSGTWIKTGGKNKKHHLLSSIVGEIKVARRKSRCPHTKNVHVHREFVLVGSEFLPSFEEPGDSHISGELAAFVSALPQQEAETSNQSSSQDTGQRNSAPIGCGCHPLGNFQPSTRNHNSRPASVIGILPDGFHGTSTSGQPLPLIERWKSGACDCGGWDEGCILSVLTDVTQDNDAIQANLAMDGSQRFELLVQGRSREDKHAFSMISFKEGLYTVEFRSSIALLQAFAMCIVMLHGRYPSRMQVGSQAVPEHDLLADHELKTMAASQGRAPTSYVPHRPPLSPVGRA